jgi:hypothetical protein
MTLTTMTTIQFPPYGRMNESFQDAMKGSGVVPGDWQGKPGSTYSREQQWSRFQEQALELLADLLWPVYTPSGWKGASAKYMEDLTRTDLDLMLYFQSQAQIDKPIHGKGTPTHRELFEIEDELTAGWGTALPGYGADLPHRLSTQVAGLFRAGLRARCGNGPLQFKRDLQRPRAYQTCLMLKRADLQNLEAKSANTPSMISGHCLQSLLGGGAVIERFLVNAEPLKGGDIPALQQNSVDMGDRRVYAGVHYPSDNISSWIVTMLMAPAVYRHPDTKRLLWEAIQMGDVYKAIRDWANSGKADVYKVPLQVLSDAYRGKYDFIV